MNTVQLQGPNPHLVVRAASMDVLRPNKGVMQGEQRQSKVKMLNPLGMQVLHPSSP